MGHKASYQYDNSTHLEHKPEIPCIDPVGLQTRVASITSVIHIIKAKESMYPS